MSADAQEEEESKRLEEEERQLEEEAQEVPIMRNLCKP